MNRKLKLGFLVSLIVNVILIGAIIGQWPRRADRSRLRDERIDRVLKGMPDADQAKLRARLKTLRAAAEPYFVRLRGAEATAIDALARDPFDEAAYDQQLTRVAEIRTEMIQKLGQLAKDVSKDLPSTERRQFTELLRPPPPPA